MTQEYYNLIGCICCCAVPVAVFMPLMWIKVYLSHTTCKLVKRLAECGLSDDVIIDILVDTYKITLSHATYIVKQKILMS